MIEHGTWREGLSGIVFKCDRCELSLATYEKDMWKASEKFDAANWYARKEEKPILDDGEDTGKTESVWCHYCSACRRRMTRDPEAEQRRYEQADARRQRTRNGWWKPEGEQDFFYGGRGAGQQAQPKVKHWMDVLELVPPVTKIEIRAARRKLSMRYHPDVDGGSLEKMQDVNAAADQGLKEMRE